MRTTFAFALLGACALAMPPEEVFMRWASKNGKQYTTVGELRERQ